jgi:uncharacterized protein
VLRVVAADSRIAGVIALTPAVDGLGIMVDVLKTRGVGFLLRLAKVGLRDVVAAATKRPAVLAPIVAPPGGVAALNAPGALEGMQAVAGPQWRNEFAARLVLTSGFYRPTRSAKRIAAPVLVQIADADGSAPPRAAAIAAEDARATVHHYPCDHFDVYPGARWHGRVLDDQTHFLRRSLDPLRRTPE